MQAKNAPLRVPTVSAHPGSHAIKLFRKHMRLVVDLHAKFASFVPLRAAAIQREGVPFLDLNESALIALMAEAIVLSRHVAGIGSLLKEGYPVQALVLLRAAMEAWFYIILCFERPAEAGEFVKSSADSKGKPKFRPWEVRRIALEGLKQAPRGDEWAKMLEEQYRLACAMVHMSNPVMSSSFGFITGEESIALSASTLDDRVLYLAYGRVLHVSTAFWFTFTDLYLLRDGHYEGGEVLHAVVNYLPSALELVGNFEPDSIPNRSPWGDSSDPDETES